MGADFTVLGDMLLFALLGFWGYVRVHGATQGCLGVTVIR